MPSTSESRSAVPAATYYVRRPLVWRDLLPAIGAGLGAGLATFYVARLLLQKTPLVREQGIAQLDERGMVVRRPRTPVARR
jgi:hypothetical protein